jgi:C_GCAxxG_C_C family probable redox protein
MGAIIDALELTDADEVFRAATSFAAGVGMMGDGSCGGYLGGVLLLGHLSGREKSDFKDEAGVRFRTYELTREYHDRFIAKYGSVTCRDIHMKIFGRSYLLSDRDDFIKFEEAGGHGDKCPAVVADAAKWAVELILREGLVGEE